MKTSLSTRWLLGALVVMTLCALSAQAQEQVSSPTAQNLVQPEVLKIPVKGAGMLGGDVAMVTHLYKPQGDGPFPVVVFSHGRGPEISDRLNLKYPVLVGHGNFGCVKDSLLSRRCGRGMASLRGWTVKMPDQSGAEAGVPASQIFCI